MQIRCSSLYYHSLTLNFVDASYESVDACTHFEVTAAITSSLLQPTSFKVGLSPHRSTLFAVVFILCSRDVTSHHPSAVADAGVNSDSIKMLCFLRDQMSVGPDWLVAPARFAVSYCSSVFSCVVPSL